MVFTIPIDGHWLYLFMVSSFSERDEGRIGGERRNFSLWVVSGGRIFLFKGAVEFTGTSQLHQGTQSPGLFFLSSLNNGHAFNAYSILFRVTRAWENGQDVT